LFRVSVQARLIRKDEEFAINSIANAHSGTSRPGENPPDLYHSWRATPLPGVTLIGVLLNPKIPASEPALRDVEAAAKTVGVRNAVGVKTSAS
jgi:hypothetical protein